LSAKKVLTLKNPVVKYIQKQDIALEIRVIIHADLSV
jgi:hypothetical protein